MATSPSATSSRSTIIRSGFSSTPRASATSTRAPTSTATPMRSMAARSCGSPACSPGRCSTPRRRPLLRGEYRIRRVTKAEANTLEELAPKLEGVDPEAFLRTVRAYNAACTSDVPFNPNILDGRSTKGLAIEKTNWAVALDTPPFHAYHVTTGVTFTFGGVKISQAGRGRGPLRPHHPRPLCGGRDGRRAVLPQLCQRHRPDVGRDLRPARRPQRGRVCARAGAASAPRRRRDRSQRCSTGRSKPRRNSWRSSPSACTSKILPASVVKQAKHCLIDAIACAMFGKKFPWSQMVLEEALASGAGGPCRLPGVPDQTFHVPQAALALGAFSHAFELDNLRNPASGVHGGATVALPAFAMAQAVRRKRPRSRHRHRRRHRGDVPHRQCDAAFRREGRLPCARHDRAVRLRRGLRLAAAAVGSADRQCLRHRRLARRRAPGIRESRLRRDDQAAASRPRRRERRYRGAAGAAWL